MIYYYKNIEATDLHKIYEYEKKQYNLFKEKLELVYGNILKQFGIHCEIHIRRWTDNITNIPYKYYDGYTAMLQIDFFDCNNSIIELDENVFSFFEDITYISYNLFKRKYKIYQANELQELWSEVVFAIKLLKENN